MRRCVIRLQGEHARVARARRREVALLLRIHGVGPGRGHDRRIRDIAVRRQRAPSVVQHAREISRRRGDVIDQRLHVARREIADGQDRPRRAPGQQHAGARAQAGQIDQHVAIERREPLRVVRGGNRRQRDDALPARQVDADGGLRRGLARDHRDRDVESIGGKTGQRGQRRLNFRVGHDSDQDDDPEPAPGRAAWPDEREGRRERPRAE